MGEPPGSEFNLSSVTKSPFNVQEEAVGKEPAGDRPQEPPKFGPWPESEKPSTTRPWEAKGESANGPVTEANPSAGKPDKDSWEEPADESDPESPAAVARARRLLYKRSDPAPSAEQELASVITYLQRLQASLQYQGPAAEVPPPDTLGLSILQAKRLSRTGVTPDPFQTGPIPRAEPIVQRPSEEAPETERKESPVLYGPPLPPQVVRLERRHSAWLVFTGALCLVTLGLIAYLWMRMGPLSHLTVAARSPAAPRAAAHPTTPQAEVSDEALSLANLALEAIQQGDFKKASGILAQARKDGVVLPGLAYQMALLAFKQGQRQEAEDWIERSIDANDSVAECWYVRANNSFATDGPASAAEDFDQAIRADPFDPRYYFFKAECLRRNGNAAAALAQFQQALRCRPTTADTDLILFKIGLTRVESSEDLIYKTELHERVAQETVSGDTLLLAAADEIGRGAFPEAAEYLKRAALALPPKTFQARIRDYVFQAQAIQPDIAAALKTALPAATVNPTQPRPVRVLIDPATRSLAEADPAGW